MDADGADPQQGAAAAAAPPPPDDRLCRYCFCPEDLEEGEGGKLIVPCGCKGGQEFCHVACLRRWQRSVLVTQPTHPAFYERDERQYVCNVCKQSFCMPPPSREELMRSFTGEELAALLGVGSLIATERRTSERMEAILSQAGHIRQVRTMAHWVKGVYLITSVEDEGASDGGDCVVAVNLTRELAEIPAELRLLTTRLLGQHAPKVEVSHFLGGPCQQMEQTAVALLHATHPDELASFARVSIGGQQGGLWVVGDLASVAAVATFDLSRREGVAKANIKCFWGDARWSRTQLLGELARGGWGMCRAEAADAFGSEAVVNTATGAAGAAAPGPDTLWEAVLGSNRLVYAPQSEMTEPDHKPPETTPQQRQEKEEQERAVMARLRNQLLEQQRRNREGGMPDGATR